MKSWDDIQLVSRVALLHDKRAFDTLVRKYQEPIRRFLLNQTCGDKQLSEDLAQDTFVKAYVNIGRFRGKSGFSTWLFRVAYNVFYDHKRRSHPTSDVANINPSGMSVEGSMGEHMDLYRAMQQLSDTERSCVSLQLMEGQSIEHIAEITGLNVNTIKSHLARGKRKLVNYLKTNGYDR